MKREIRKILNEHGIKSSMIEVHPRYSLKDGMTGKYLETLLTNEDCISIGLTYAKEKGYAHCFAAIRQAFLLKSGKFQSSVGMHMYNIPPDLKARGLDHLKFYHVRGTTIWFDNIGRDTYEDDWAKCPVHITDLASRIPVNLFEILHLIPNRIVREPHEKTFILDSFLI